MFASRITFLPARPHAPGRPSLRPLPDEADCLAEPLCFHTPAHSFVLRKMLSPVLSSACALFAQKHRGVGYRSSSLGARTRHTCHQHFACKPFSFSRLRTLSVTAGTVAFGVHFARQSAASHSGSRTTVSLSPFFSQISQTPSDNSFACTHFQKTPRGRGTHLQPSSFKPHHSSLRCNRREIQKR